jgi:hypothetical protein
VRRGRRALTVDEQSLWQTRGRAVCEELVQVVDFAVAGALVLRVAYENAMSTVPQREIGFWTDTPGLIERQRLSLPPAVRRRNPLAQLVADRVVDTSGTAW